MEVAARNGIRGYRFPIILPLPFLIKRKKMKKNKKIENENLSDLSDRALMIDYIVNKEDEISWKLLKAIGDEISRKGDLSEDYKRALEQVDGETLKSIYLQVRGLINNRRK